MCLLCIRNSKWTLELTMQFWLKTKKNHDSYNGLGDCQNTGLLMPGDGLLAFSHGDC